MNNKLQLHNCDNIELMATLPDESIDVICIDPPYLYLKNQKLERVFDEPKFFSECKRLLTKNGFIVMFGRGTSFYRWNTILDGLGFTFKEEIIWDKAYTSSPVSDISRMHETVSIFTKGKGTINRVKVKYLDVKNDDVKSVISDIKRMRSILNNTTSLNAVLDFLKNNEPVYTEKPKRFSVSCSGGSKLDRDRAASVLNAIVNGMLERTLIREVRDHYTSIHPTQKPVRLIERLLALVIPEDKPRNEIIVSDFFGGSMSTMEAVHNLGMKGIACEIDPEYFQDGKKRIDQVTCQQSLFAINQPLNQA